MAQHRLRRIKTKSPVARISYPDPDAQSDELRDQLKRLGSLNVTRMMSHAEGLMSAYSRMATELLLRGKLDPVLRELVILRVGQLCGSDYEWHQHISVARAIGTEEAKLDALQSGRFEKLQPEELAALRVAEDIQRLGKASPENFVEAQRWFSAEQLVELVMVTGYYIMTAGFLQSFDIEIEDTPPLGASFKATRNK